MLKYIKFIYVFTCLFPASNNSFSVYLFVYVLFMLFTFMLYISSFIFCLHIMISLESREV